MNFTYVTDTCTKFISVDYIKKLKMYTPDCSCTQN